MVPIEGYEPFGIEKYKEALSMYKLKPKIRRPVTDSKMLKKHLKQSHDINIATLTAKTDNKQRHNSSDETDKLFNVLHTVAGNLRKTTDQVEEILTSPVFRRKSKSSTTSQADNAKNKNSADVSNIKRKPNKKLFSSSSEDESKNDKSKPTNTNTNISGIVDNNEPALEVRVSYDSDDMLVYAKKQAAKIRCSAPARLLTSQKCKKLLSSCPKQQKSEKRKDDGSSKINFVQPDNIQGPKNSKRKCKMKKSNIKSTEEDKSKIKKRKLLPLQVMTKFQQDSEDSTPDLTPISKNPYAESPSKPKKINVPCNSKTINHLPVAPLSSDWESDDSLTRAARRESSALFIKKQRKVVPQRFIPTIVFTSLHRSDVEVVSSIVSKLGKFAVERTVSEHTTHVVTCSSRRTINLLKGIARGCWILHVQWVYESLEAGKWLHEERFEFTEFAPSVQQARVERQAFGPEFGLELFQGLGPMYVCHMTVPPASDLIELIQLCGGTVVTSARVAKIIIGKTLPFSPPGHQTPLVVKEKWVLDCITQLSQLNPYNYIAVDMQP